MQAREKLLLVIFVLALLGWIFSSYLGINESAVAIVVMGAMLVLGVVTWDDVVKIKAAGTR